MVDFLDTDGLPGQRFAEIDLLPVKADAAAAGDDRGPVVERMTLAQKKNTKSGGELAAATGSRLPLAARLNSARRVYVNTYRVANPQKQSTRVLHSPPDVRNAEMSDNIQPSFGWNGVYRYCHFVILAVNPK